MRQDLLVRHLPRTWDPGEVLKTSVQVWQAPGTVQRHLATPRCAQSLFDDETTMESLIQLLFKVTSFSISTLYINLQYM